MRLGSKKKERPDDPTALFWDGLKPAPTLVPLVADRGAAVLRPYNATVA